MATQRGEPIEVRRTRDGWKVRRVNWERWYRTQLEAELSARELARSNHAEFVLKDERGGVRVISTYGDRHELRASNI